LTKEKLEYEAKSAVADLEPLSTEYIQLNYMRADEAKSMLYGSVSGASRGNSGANGTVDCSAQAQGLTDSAISQSSQQGQGDNDQKVLTKRGRATYELKTNTLILTDTPRKIQEVRELLTRLDVPARQVMIEARVVLATDGWSRDLGARLVYTGVPADGKAQDLLAAAPAVGLGCIEERHTEVDGVAHKVDPVLVGLARLAEAIAAHADIGDGKARRPQWSVSHAGLLRCGVVCRQTVLARLAGPASSYRA
jgi:hypothetical protein